jgi:glucose/arabinose dehydrogenase
MKIIAILSMLIAGSSCNDARKSSVADARAETVGAKSGDAQVARQGSTMRLEQVGGRFRSPVYVTSPPGDSRLFVVEQAGTIRVIKNGRTLEAPFLDISSRVKSGGEQGLLSMAFHPDFRNNGWFYVNFTDNQGDTHVERFGLTRNPDVANRATARLVLRIDQPYANHNGGLVMFGPDGMLYVGMGDGGSGGDPHGNGQNPRALLGKLLRINVSRGEPYTIPVGNPYANGSGGAPEVWAIGMRNPWRFAFDRAEGTLYIADVGQNKIEEIDVVPASRAGINYGWNLMEGEDCYRHDNCNRSGLQIPTLTYDHSGGACTVIGGFVYRGRRIPSIVGHYFYSDYCAGWLRSFRYSNGAATARRDWKIQDIGNVVSFGEDSAGEIYIVAENGRIFRFDGVE